MADVYTADDTLVISDRIMADFADGDVARITYPNEVSTVKTGKNKNSLGAHNETGNQAELEIRIVKGSPDDKWMNTQVELWKARDDRFVPLKGEFTKSVVNELGNKVNEIVTLNFGLPSINVETKTNTDGDTEQVVSVYKAKFGRSARSLA